MFAARGGRRLYCTKRPEKRDPVVISGRWRKCGCVPTLICLLLAEGGGLHM